MNHRRLHVGCSPLTGRIYAGSISKDGQTWLSNKTDVTGSACGAVIEKALAEDGITVRSRDAEYRITVTKVDPATPPNRQDGDQAETEGGEA